MRRLAEPLRLMGAVLRLRDDEYAPVVLEEGVKQPIVYRMPVHSAQVKSAILFAGLRFPGTRVSEPLPTRDHTERLFEHLKIQPGRLKIPPFQYDVPGDPSSAAFLIVRALLRKNSDVTFRNLLMNPYRVAYMRKLHQAGAPIEISNRHLVQNELVADVRIRSGVLLSPIQILPEEAPSMIDEIPVLSLLGSVCGFEVSGAEELRHKESDRIDAMVSNLDQMGLRVEEKEDGYRVWPGSLRESVAETRGDHRIAMTFAAGGMEIDDPDCVKISFPEFFTILEKLSS
jgi:3-phosphoshikimate 1-carboxyvinyltransferase